MNKKEFPNIAWVVVDSVRSYSGVKDSRDFLDIFYKLSKEGTRFFNVQTSAPSTIMSTSAMFSGIDSIKHATTYDGFDANKNDIKYLKEYISPLGYNIYLITFFPEGFKFLGSVFDGITSRKSKKSPPENRFWSNNEITNVLSDLISKKVIKQPFLLYLNYNCRNDPNTSEEVEKGINILKNEFNEKGLYFIINSDHGYPDPSKKLKNEIPLMGHDLVMTEDNITTPLIIIGNGFKPKNKVYERVGLLDISDLIKAITKEKLDSSNLFNLANSRNISHRIYSTWNRYIAQPNGKVCLVKDDLKLVYDLDRRHLSFYKINNIAKDNEWYLSEEELDINANGYQDKFSLLEKYLKNEILNIEDFFINYLTNKIHKNWKENKIKKLFLVGEFTPIYTRVIKKICIEGLEIICLDISKNKLINKIILNQYSNRDGTFVYVLYGASISRWIREIIFFNLKYRRLLLFTNFNLEDPKYVFMIYKFFPKLFYQFFKSLKTKGFINTLKIISQKI